MTATAADSRAHIDSTETSLGHSRMESVQRPEREREREMSEEKKPGQAMTFAFRHLPTGQGYAEWRVWLDGAGYDFDDDSYQAEAFAAGMRAAPDLADDLCAERKQVTELREVLTEIFTCLDAGDPALLDDEQKAEWRQRARMEAQQ